MNMFAIGCYTRHTTVDARGKGITIVDYDESADEYRVIDIAEGITNPSYLYWEAGERVLYAISETDERMASVAAFRVAVDGITEPLGQQKGEGRSACHLTLIPEQRRLYTASYSDGRLTSYRLAEQGVGPSVMTRVYEGHGPNADRQESSHAHQVTRSPYGPHLYVCDLGSDAVWMHPVESADDDTIGEVKALAVPPGYGPRHLAYDPQLPVAYIQCELEARILVAAIDTGSGLMTIVEEHDTAAASDMAISAPAAVKVHPSGRSLAVSNRFDDTIAVFSIDREGGGIPTPKLTLAARFPCGGKAPRDIEFNRSGTRLLIANQDTHNVTCRHFNSTDGLPEADWGPELSTGTPVCIVRMS